MNQGSSSSELSTTLKDVLEKRGVLAEVRAKLRCEIFKSLNDKGPEKPQLCKENFLINELIREYLLFNQYHHTHSVLLAESSHPKERLERDFLAHELNVRGSDSMPLLYGILAHFQQQKANYEEKTHETNPSLFSSSKHKPAKPENCTFEEPVYHNTS